MNNQGTRSDPVNFHVGTFLKSAGILRSLAEHVTAPSWIRAQEGRALQSSKGLQSVYCVV